LGERKVEYEIDAVEDRKFLHVMGALLDPSAVRGSRDEVLDIYEVFANQQK
jgi:hypothetical protein